MVWCRKFRRKRLRRFIRDFRMRSLNCTFIGLSLIIVNFTVCTFVTEFFLIMNFRVAAKFSLFVKLFA